jgi:nitrogen regulatory protein P-II 1
MSKIEIITRPDKLEELKEAMYAIGVTGMTVSQVFGCGLSKGHT